MENADRNNLTPQNGDGNGNGNGNGYAELPKTVAIVYSDARREYFPTEEQYITEAEAEKDAYIISKYAERLGVNAYTVPGNADLPENLKNLKPEMVFNLVDSIKGYEYLSSAIPGILESLEIPYTGADILGLALNYNKFLVKKLLHQFKVPVPNFQLFLTSSDPLEHNLRFPLIVKLNEIHGAVEITKDSVVENEKAMRARIKYLLDTYKQAVLVEEYIVGREITAYVLEGLNRKVYLAEKVFNKPDEKYVFLTFDDQWVNQNETFKYEKYDDPYLKELVLTAFDAIKLMDYGKFDIRRDGSGRYFFIDANANPAFGPKECQTAMGYILEDLYKIPFPDILKRLMLNTLKCPPKDY